MTPNHALVASIGSDAHLIGLAVFAVAVIVLGIIVWRQEP